MTRTTAISMILAAIFACCLLSGCARPEKQEDTIVGIWTKIDVVPMTYVFNESGTMTYGGIEARYEQPDPETLLIHFRATDTGLEATLEYSMHFSDGNLVLENRHDRSDIGTFRRAEDASEGWSNVKELRITDRAGKKGKVYPTTEPPREPAQRTPARDETITQETSLGTRRDDPVPASPATLKHGGETERETVSVGDSKAHVLATLGQPRTTGGTPGKETLIYQDGWVDFENGKVVHIHLSRFATSTDPTQQRQESPGTATLSTPNESRAVPGDDPDQKNTTPFPSGHESDELTDERIAWEVENFLGFEHKVVSSTVLSLRREGEAVMCEFRADVRPRFIDPGARIEPYSGPVKGALQLTPEGGALKFKGKYESVPSGTFSATREGTITRTWSPR